MTPDHFWPSMAIRRSISGRHHELDRRASDAGLDDEDRASVVQRGERLGSVSEAFFERSGEGLITWDEAAVRSV